LSITENKKEQGENKPRPFVDLLVSIVIPSVVLMKFSGPEKLGATWGLVVALAFPIAWGLWELFANKKRNWVALLGVVSVLLTGGIGLFEIDSKWLAVKEAAIPAIIGIGVLVASKMGFPLVRKLLFNPTIMNVDRISEELQKNDKQLEFEQRLDRANYFFAGTFAFSAVMNFILAKWLVTSDSGTTAFNEELGRMTLLSYPMIAIPSMIMMVGIFFFIWKTANKLTGLTLEEMVAQQDGDDKEENA